MSAGLLIAAISPVTKAGMPSRMRYIMGTICEIQSPDPDAQSAISAALDEIDRWDRILSLYKKESELNALNSSAGRGAFHASSALMAATQAAMRLANQTGGAFDPTVGAILSKGPGAMPLVGWKLVRLDIAQNTIELPRAGMSLDFGGIGKGWALDQAAQVLQQKGVRNAFINFGGQILAIGEPANGKAWDIQLPGHAQPLNIHNASVSTSGDSMKPGHIVSPFSGKPIHRTTQATAVMPSATDADAWSTALYVLGHAPDHFAGQFFFTPQDNHQTTPSGARP